MKKITVTAFLVSFSLIASAQGDQYEFSREVFRTCSILFIILAIMVFILVIIRKVMENRLRNKIIDKGVSEQTAQSILGPALRPTGNGNLLWVCLLGALGGGLMGVNYTQPLGIHSLAIMAFSLSAGFLLHYLLTRSEKQQ